MHEEAYFSAGLRFASGPSSEEPSVCVINGFTETLMRCRGCHEPSWAVPGVACQESTLIVAVQVYQPSTILQGQLTDC